MQKKLVSMLVSDTVVLAVVGLNALVLFLDAFPLVHEHFGTQLFAVDYICILYFIVEAVLKLFFTERGRYFSDGWNSFDLVIVLVSSPALLAPFGLMSHSLAGLLVLRLARLLRFLRLLQFIPNIDRLLEGARRALRASVGILLVTFFYIFIFGIAGTYFFGLGPNGMPEFSDPLMSMYTMFKVFTVEGWYEMSDTIAGTSTAVLPHFVRVFFVIAVIFGGIIILSLLNAVFVDEMSSDIAERQQDEVARLQVQVKELRGEVLERLERIAAGMPHNPPG